MFSFTAYSALRGRVAAALVLLAGPVLAASAADTHPPVVRRPALTTSKPKNTPAGSKRLAAPAPSQPVASVAAEQLSTPATPTTVQLKGIVLAPDGRPCAGASVYPAGAPRQLVVTDAQGAFTLPVPAGAAVALRVEYFGEGSSRVDVPSPGSQPLRITLGQ